MLELETQEEWFIQAPWGRICIVTWGSCEDPPVLLGHGFETTAVSWRPLIQLMPNQFYFVGIEFPGNGKSDRLPAGLNVSFHDMLYAVEVVRKHFRWERFVYMGHSMGTAIGKMYNLANPGRMIKVVDIDPWAPYNAVPPGHFADWYHKYFTQFYQKYHVLNSSKENAPKRKREEVLSTIIARGFPRDTAVDVLDRMSEPLGGGFIRFTSDQRLRLITPPPYSPEQMKQLYTNLTTPTLTIVASVTLKSGRYNKTPFALDEKSYPHNNFRVVHVKGGHNVHIEHPERMAAFVERFLLYGVEGLDRKAKL